MAKTCIVRAESLHTFVKTVFTRAGVRPDHATDAADVLLWASRRGVDTHGVRNLKPLYIHQIDAGRINLRPRFRIDHETPVSARVDGDGGLGLAAACWAMRLAIAKAEQSGIGFVAMHNSYHFGAAGYYPGMALAHDMVGISMTGRLYAQGTDLGVLPTFGARPMFSTNPLAIAFPTQEEAPFLLDMATSIVPLNRVWLRRDAGETVPEGWGYGDDGRPTTDPSVLVQLLPLGGSREMGGHKGYGLAMMVEVLCALLSGGWSDRFSDTEQSFNRHRQINDAHFFGAMRIDAFRPADDFKRGMDAMIQALHASPTAPGHDRIYTAGEIEHETEQQRLQNGIPLSDTVLADLRELSQRFGAPLDLDNFVQGSLAL